MAFLSSIVYYSIEQLLPSIFEKGEIPLLILLDRVTDVRNMGAIARTAECVGAQAIITPTRGGALINSDAIKASAGALHRVPVCREDNLKLTLEFLSSCGLQIIACTEKTDKLIYGTRAVIEAVREGKEIEKLFIQRGLHNPLISELKKQLKDSDVFFNEVPSEKLNRLTQ